MNDLIITISNRKGFRYLRHTRVHGGDINQAYSVETDKGAFFLKLNHASAYPKMFQKEAEGLHALQNKSLLKIPTVIGFGEVEDSQWLLLEWLDKSNPSSDFWEQLGTGLATQHQHTNERFGWEADNYIGSLVQINQYCHEWAEFYCNCRLMPLVKRLFDSGILSKKDIADTEELCSHLKEIYPPEPPSLLHGDLWSGNFLVASNGVPALYDPAVYYGHREIDIAMTKLFGGFDNRFYDQYNETYSLEKDWRKRLPLSQLYPLLVHAVLFGGGYTNQCRNIINDWKK